MSALLKVVCKMEERVSQEFRRISPLIVNTVKKMCRHGIPSARTMDVRVTGTMRLQFDGGNVFVVHLDELNPDEEDVIDLVDSDNEVIDLTAHHVTRVRGSETARGLGLMVRRKLWLFHHRLFSK